MVHRNLIVTMAALASIGSPRLARAGETPAELMERVSVHHAAKRFAEAATLADESARREDLDAPVRVALGGLARQNYELSFKKGGPPTELCKAAAILRHVVPLDPKGGAAKLKAAEEAEEKLAAVLGPTWRTACLSAAEPDVATTASTGTKAEPATVAATSARDSGAAGATESNAAGARPPPPPPDDQLGRRHARAGVGTLVSGLVLFAPMVGLLAYRAAGERDLTAVDIEATRRPNTETDYATAAALSRRYTATTAGAIVLGVTGVALAVTGAALLGSGTRQRRMAVTPWGSREAGGLVLRGRF